MILWVTGAVWLMDPPSFLSTRIRIIQPCIEQELKWDRLHFWDHLDELIRLSRHPCVAIDHESTTGSIDKKITQPCPWPHAIIWPEMAVTAAVNQESVLNVLHHAHCPNSYLITGGIRYETFSNGLRNHGLKAHGLNGDRPRIKKIFDSIAFINPKGIIVETYDKHHLVPFGEYMPIKAFGLQKLTHGALDYSIGKGVRTIELIGLGKVSPLVCYEILFPGKVVDPKNKPQWILNLTNDAWFGRSVGPYQHLRIAQVRAIEEGIAVIRCANNGISAIIDGRGRILKHLPLNIIGIINGHIPAPVK